MFAKFLFGTFRARVLSALLLPPDAAFHVRELAYRLGASPGTTSRELVKLSQVGILTRQLVGNQVHYRPNHEFPAFQELTALLRKASAIDDDLLKK